MKNHGALLISLGIFLSRIFGLIRERLFAMYLGNSIYADIFKVALRIPNFLQNLFGEGALSAAFIPHYSEALASKKEEDRILIAHTIFFLLLLISSLLVILGIYFSKSLVQWMAPGLDESAQQLTEKLVTILFPGTGLLVMSSWCLGVLNSHKKFFMSYFSPVFWNGAIIFSLVYFGQKNFAKWDWDFFLIAISWSVVFGSFLQFAVQLPSILKLLPLSPFKISLRHHKIKRIMTQFFPALLTRGVIQISSIIDNVIASFLKTGAISSLSYAQTISTLPLSLFGLSIAQSELTELSHIEGKDLPKEERKPLFENQLAKALAKLNFLLIPTTVAFLLLGDVIVGILFQTGKFDHKATFEVWIILAGQTFGLIKSAKSRLLNSALYAKKNTTSSFRIVLIRLTTSTFFGLFFCIGLPKILKLYAPEISIDSYLPVGLTLAFGISAHLEFFLLKRSLKTFDVNIIDDLTHQGKIFIISIMSAITPLLLKYAVIPTDIYGRYLPFIGIILLGIFSLSFLLLAYWTSCAEMMIITLNLKKVKDKFKNKFKDKFKG